MGLSRHTHDYTFAPATDRRNHFAREGLRRAVARRFASGDLAISAGRAARLFELPLALCERLLEELVSTGALVRSTAGTYTRPRRPVGSVLVGEGRR
jgi:hypothetical protein